MQVIRDVAAADAITDPELRRLIQQRIDDLSEYEDDGLVNFIIVELGDAIETIDAELGFSILGNRWDGSRWGDPAFTPSWEILEEHQHPEYFELVWVISDDGTGITAFVPKLGIDPDLLAMCKAYATHGPAR